MKLLITRPEHMAKALSEKLISEGHEVLCSPVLEIVFRDVKNLDLDGVQAFVVTSANGLRGLAQATDNRELPLFAVGDKTANAARSAGFKTVFSAEGDVAALATLIANKGQKGGGDLLHVGGARLAGDLAAQVTAAGFTYRREILYDAIEAEKFSIAARAAIFKDELDGILLFSPHTAKVFKRVVDAESLNAHIEKLDAWCLSSNVAQELDGHNFRRVFVSKRPTEDALLELIQRNLVTSTQKEIKSPDRSREHTVSKTPKMEATPKSIAKKSEADQAVKSPIPATKVDKTSKDKAHSSTPSMSKTSQPAKADTAPKKSVALRNMAALFFVFCLGLAAWPLLLPQVAPFLPEQTRNIVQGYIGNPATDKLLAGKLARLEQQITAAAAAHKRSEQNLRALSALKIQVEKGSTGSGSALKGLADRLGALESATAVLGGSVADLKAAPGQIRAAALPNTQTAPAALASLANLEASLAALKTAISKVQREQILAETDRSDQQSQIGTLSSALKAQADKTHQNNANGDETLILLALGQLHRQSRSNQPFSGALGQALAVAPEALQDKLSNLGAISKTGAPTLRELTEDFVKIATDSTQAARLPSSDTWYGKTLHNLASLVKFRRVDDISGHSVDALVAQAEEKIRTGDLAAGIALLKNLEAEPLKVAAPWIGRAENRVQVDTTLTHLLELVTASAVLEKQAGK